MSFSEDPGCERALSFRVSVFARAPRCVAVGRVEVGGPAPLRAATLLWTVG